MQNILHIKTDRYKKNSEKGECFFHMARIMLV